MELSARQLVIKMVQTHPRPIPATWSGIQLAVYRWLGVLSTFTIDRQRRYNFTCKTEEGAKILWANFGGYRHGKVVHGNAVDLTL